MPEMKEDKTVEPTLADKGKEKVEPKQAGVTMDQVVQAVRVMAAEMASLKKDLESTKRTPPPPPVQKAAKAEDLETLSRKEFAEHLVERVKTEVVKPVEERIVQSEEETTAAGVRAQLAQVSKEKSDFWDWQGEMVEVLKKHPTLGVEEAYRLARAGNPDKAQTIDKAAVEKDVEKQKKDKPETTFGGLLPTSGRASKNKRMSPKTAAEQAWDELGVSEHLRAITSD